MIKYFFIFLFFSSSISIKVSAADLKIPQELQNKTISLVVGYGPGGRNDLFARYLTKHIKDNYNFNITVINKPGASGALGAKFVAEAVANGTVLHIANDAFILGSLLGSPSWPTKNQLEPVVNIWSTNNMLIGSNRLTSLNLLDLMNEMKTTPNKFSYATVFVADGLQFELILRHFSIRDVVSVPFKSGPEIKNSLANNTVQFWITGVGDGLATIKSGVAKPLLTTGSKRLTELPSVPTLSEIIPNAVFRNVTTLYLPKNSNQNIINFYNRLFYLISKNPDVVNYFESQHYDLLDVHDHEQTKVEWNTHWENVKSYVTN